MLKIRRVLTIILDEASLTLRNPLRLRLAHSGQRVKRRVQAWRNAYHAPVGLTSDDDGFVRRRYSSYEEYVRHQGAKLEALPSDKYVLRAMSEVLPGRISSLGLSDSMSVLCLGARTGAECEAFIAAGHFAVGIDLNPGESSFYVLQGDFHRLQFANSSLDMVFTNSLDHAFDIDTVIAEARRVLKPTGLLWIEAQFGSDERYGLGPGAYEALGWRFLGSLVRRISDAGFDVQSETDVELPWRGKSILFSKSESGCADAAPAHATRDGTEIE